MSRATAWILISLMTGALAACAMGSHQSEIKPITGPVLVVYKYEFDKVWRAAQKVLGKYPIRTNNIEVGILETEIIRGDKGFRAAHVPAKTQPGLRYQIILKLVRGQNTEGMASTEVSIEKRISLEKNFFAEGKRLASDGLEEEALFYRIDRELTIERALDKAYENPQQ